MNGSITADLIVRGQPTTDELAALVAVLIAGERMLAATHNRRNGERQGDEHPSGRKAPPWRLILQRPLVPLPRPGPGAWRTAFRL